MRNIVEIKEVFKTIDKEEILSGINLQISEGEIYGFLGPNGAGKTTLMKCMLSLSTVTSGSIEIFGKNLQDHREEILSQVGSIIETPIFYENCTAKEILKIHAQYMGENITDNLFFLIFASFISLMIVSFSIYTISRKDINIK